MPKIKKILYFIVIFTFFAVPLFPGFAAEFNPNYVISDEDLTDYSSMSADEIQRFLERKGSYLAQYECEDTDGVIRKAADIIYRIANTYFISPKFLLALIQKEQSLVEDPTPKQSQLDWAAGYGVCDSCTHYDEQIQRWKGFAKQIRSSAMQFIEGYLVDLHETGQTGIGYGPGIAIEIDGEIVTPYNNATAANYTYNPHIHGNRNLWSIWQRWFTQLYPNGSLVQAIGEPGIWLIQHGQKRPFHSMAALMSRYDSSRVIPVSKSDLDRYETGRPIKFPDYSLLRSPRGTVFLLDGDQLRGIDSWDTFKTIGFNPDEIIEVEWSDINLYDLGEPITLVSVYPQGALLQNKLTGGVYYVQNAEKYPIWSKEIMKSGYSKYIITQVSPEELDKYQTMDPIGFQDGTLVKAFGQPSVYVISEGLRRPIPSADVFEGMGYKWQNIIETTDKALSLHEIGEPLYLLSGDVETAGN